MARAAWAAALLGASALAPGAAPLALDGGAASTARAAESLYQARFADADGKLQPLSRWRGKILVVNFWATWCAPCVAEMPELQRLQDRYASRGVAIVGMGTQGLDTVRQFRDRLGLRMVLLAGDFDAVAIARDLGDTQGALPYTAVFSREGALLHTRLGALQPGQLRGWLEAATRQPGKGS
jgi:thiol-disulfide isomerase/thioredoxin